MSGFHLAPEYGPTAVKADLRLTPTGWWGLTGELVCMQDKLFLVTPLTCTKLKALVDPNDNDKWKNGTHRMIMSATRVSDTKIKLHARFQYDNKAWVTEFDYLLDGSYKYKWTVAKSPSHTVALSHTIMLVVGVASIFFLAGTVVGSRR